MVSAANEAATAPLLAKDSDTAPAPRPSSPAVQSHHDKSTYGTPTSGAVTLQSRSAPCPT
jgi:hypothetical protein